MRGLSRRDSTTSGFVSPGRRDKEKAEEQKCAVFSSADGVADDEPSARRVDEDDPHDMLESKCQREPWQEIARCQDQSTTDLKHRDGPRDCGSSGEAVRSEELTKCTNRAGMDPHCSVGNYNDAKEDAEGKEEVSGLWDQQMRMRRGANQRPV